jgi:hypothetical protein
MPAQLSAMSKPASEIAITDTPLEAVMDTETKQNSCHQDVLESLLSLLV